LSDIEISDVAAMSFVTLQIVKNCGASWMHGEQYPKLISLILWSVCVVNMRQFELRERFFARITACCWHPCAVTAAHPRLPI